MFFINKVNLLLYEILGTDFFEHQTTFSKNVIKTFRPKTFDHPRFEFDKKATDSSTVHQLRICVTTSTRDLCARRRTLMQLKHKCQIFLYVIPHIFECQDFRKSLL